MKRLGTVMALGLKDKAPKNTDLDIMPVSKDAEWGSLSPFHLGPCRSADGIMFHNFENLWQYSKVYEEHLENTNLILAGEINSDWYQWHLKGARSKQAHRYPMGKGQKALFSKWGDLRLSYIPARKQIYVPGYAELLLPQKKFKQLLKQYKAGANIIVRDYDTYDLLKAYPNSNRMWLDALNNPNAKFGHSFVIALALILHDRPLWYNQWVI
ncbi:hypothetical protein pEaSNUABM46_00264 [Erwinia phage pEa_SNUABM_46]|nr:hypothetical protein pEaSNUABM45_00264 [Erwinia phage pEa_SNUABM_45]QYW04248.1 hypothetical protein pEaSNUABM46_00264 [Erwinia phage pEa_SNUABM_46]